MNTPCLACMLVLASMASCRDHETHVSSPEPTESQAGLIRKVHLPVPNQAPVVRVRLQRVTGDLEPVVFAHDAQSVLIQDPDGKHVTRRGPLTVRRDDHGWLVRSADSSKLTRSMQDAPWLGLSASGGLELSDDSGQTRRYMGEVRCVHIPGDHEPTWDIVEHVDIESYLPGVLSGELYGHWGEQCQRAQAIAARSYAAMECILRTGRHWDVLDTPGSQVYLGMIEDPRTLAACRMTSGLVLTWGAELVPGYFSSCCGGRAATATEAIGPNPINAVPPLAGHAGDGYCQSAPRYSWETECDGAALGRAIRAASDKGTPARSIGIVSRIEIIGRNQHGRGVQLKVTDTSGRHVEMAASSLMTASGGMAGGPLYSGWLEGSRSGGTLRLSGHGYGHGAGLCQYGAAAMDREGKSYWEMIEFYYPGAEVKKAW